LSVSVVDAVTPHVFALTVIFPPLTPPHVNVVPLSDPIALVESDKNDCAVTSLVVLFAYVAFTVYACVNGVPTLTVVVTSLGVIARLVGATHGFGFGPPGPESFPLPSVVASLKKLPPVSALTVPSPLPPSSPKVD
jgi:hypothetical protein